MHASSWAFNPTGFEHWSPKLFQIHGLDPRGNAETQKEYLALVHSEDGVRLGDHPEMFAEGGRFDFTRRIVRPDVKIPSMRCVGAPTTHGKILKMVGWNRGRCD